MDARRATCPAVVAGLALAVVALAAPLGPASATLAAGHGNHVSADPQVTADGTVVVETVFALEGSYLVLHADDGGSPGRVLGHVGIERGVTHDVRIDAGDYLADRADPVRLRAAVHTDDGDGEFEPGEDPVLETVGGVVATSLPVATGEDPALVTAHEPRPQRSTGTVVIRRVVLPGPGHLVVRTDDGGETPGRVLGHASLSPGTHAGVRVSLNRSALAGRDRPFRVRAVAYADDGDGEFDDGDDPIRVGDRPVATRFFVRSLVSDAEGTTTTTGTTTTGTTTATTTGTTTATTAATTTDTTTDAVPGTSATTGTSATAAVDDGTPSSGPATGFGVGVAVLAVVAAVLLRARRR